MDDTTPFYYGTVLQNQSTLLAMTAGATPDTGNTPFILPSAPDGLTLPLTGGSDGNAAPTPADYIGTDNGPGQSHRHSGPGRPRRYQHHRRSGRHRRCRAERTHHAMRNVEIPIRHSRSGTARRRHDAHARRHPEPARSIRYTKYAAIYYPRIVVFDLLTQLGHHGSAERPHGRHLCPRR